MCLCLRLRFNLLYQYGHVQMIHVRRKTDSGTGGNSYYCTNYKVYKPWGVLVCKPEWTGDTVISGSSKATTQVPGCVAAGREHSVYQALGARLWFGWGYVLLTRDAFRRGVTAWMVNGFL